MFDGMKKWGVSDSGGRSRDGGWHFNSMIDKLLRLYVSKWDSLSIKTFTLIGTFWISIKMLILGLSITYTLV